MTPFRLEWATDIHLEFCGVAPDVVVECRSSLPEDRRLQFATAIADADAALSGQMRNIYVYVGARQFAQADPPH